MSPGQASGDKPGNKAPQPGKKPTPPPKGQKAPAKSSGQSSRSGSGASGGGKGRAGTPVNAPQPSRFSPSTMLFVAIGIVVVIVLVFVVVTVTKPSNSTSTAGPVETPIQSPVLTAVTTAPFSIANAVGVPGSVSVPKVASNQPVLKINGKPAVVFIGALFCPYCAAERWAIIIALSPYGTWSGLNETTSSPYDTDPSTATFAFDHATYTSNYITFVGREAESNDTTALGTRKPLQALTSQESTLWSKYSSFFGLQGEGFPFLDIGNQVFVVSPSYDPAVLAGLDQAEIAQKLSDPNDPVTQAIFGTVNYIRAGACHVTGQAPTTVCSQSGVKAAAKAMGLSS